MMRETKINELLIDGNTNNHIKQATEDPGIYPLRYLNFCVTFAYPLPIR